MQVARTAAVSQLKETLVEKTGMAAGRQKLVLEDGTVMKNSTPVSTLADYQRITLVAKERGGKKG